MSTPIPPPLCLRPSVLDVPTPDVDPARWNGVAMGSDKFRALPRVPGYKHELIDGTARIRPVDSPLVLLAAPTADLRTRTQPPDRGTVRPLAPDDRDALVTLWADIFVEMPDYGGVDRDDIRADAQEQIDALLDNPEGADAMRSRVALRDGTVVGGLLADTFGAVPQIDVLFVAPEVQRQGVGAALLHAFARAVLADDEPRIISTSHPANTASRQWHRTMGFVPLPSRSLVQHVRICLRTNLAHGHVPAERGRPVEAMLAGIVDRLRDAERSHPTSVHPIQWRREPTRLEQYLLV